MIAAPRWVACVALGGLPTVLGFAWLFCLLCAFVCVLRALAFPCFASGLLALPLCGAAPTFLCRLQRKVGKRKQLKPLRKVCTTGFLHVARFAARVAVSAKMLDLEHSFIRTVATRV